MKVLNTVVRHWPAIAVVICFSAILGCAWDVGDTAKEQFFEAVDKGDVHAAEAALTKRPDLANGTFLVHGVWDGGKPLQVVAAKNDLAMAVVLLRSGARVNDADGRGCTALHSAAGQGNTQMVKLLLSHGAEPWAAKYSGSYPFGHAVGMGQRQTALLLAPYEKKTKLRLHAAAVRGDMGEIESLVQSDRSLLAARDSEGSTALHYVVMVGPEAACHLLVKLGADVNAKDNYGDTPFHMAMYNRKEGLACFFLQHGADSTLADGPNARRTPLHIAAYKGLPRVVKILLSRGVGVNQKALDNSTPLDLAQGEGHRDIVRLLLRAGAKHAVQLPRTSPVQR